MAGSLRQKYEGPDRDAHRNGSDGGKSTANSHKTPPKSLTGVMVQVYNNNAHLAKCRMS